MIDSFATIDNSFRMLEIIWTKGFACWCPPESTKWIYCTAAREAFRGWAHIGQHLSTGYLDLPKWYLGLIWVQSSTDIWRWKQLQWRIELPKLACLNVRQLSGGLGRSGPVYTTAVAVANLSGLYPWQIHHQAGSVDKPHAQLHFVKDLSTSRLGWKLKVQSREVFEPRPKTVLRTSSCNYIVVALCNAFPEETAIYMSVAILRKTGHLSESKGPNPSTVWRLLKKRSYR